jgi:hypothetical protein
MEFPIFQVPYLGNGMTIALNAVLHIIIVQGITTGVITMIALAEYIGFKKSSEHWENFAKQLLKPTLIIITGVGSVTGVGVWFITSALSPKVGFVRCQQFILFLQPFSSPDHTHITITEDKLIQHLGESFFLGCYLFRSGNPAYIVILLIRRSIVVCIHKLAPYKCLTDEVRHWIYGSFESREVLYSHTLNL